MNWNAPCEKWVAVVICTAAVLVGLAIGAVLNRILSR